MSTEKCVYDYDQLRKIAPPPSPPGIRLPPCKYVFVSGFPNSENTGLRGFFEWCPNSSRDDDGGTVIKPNAVSGQSKGRWLRVFEGPISVRWFGAKGDGDTNSVADDTEAIRLAIGAATAAGGGIVFFPAGTYVIGGSLGERTKTHSLDLRSEVTFSGVGWKSILRLKGDSTSNENDAQMFFAGPTGMLSNLVFQNLYLMTTDQRGVSTLLLQHQFALRWYETAWMMLHKLGRAKVNLERKPLRAEVEVDETWVGRTQAGLWGRFV
jgi:hypothetical protein